MFHHFGWKLPIQGQIFRVLGGKYGSDFNLSFYNPKKAHPCAIPRLLSHCASKSAHGSLLYVGPRKINEKATQKVIFHPFAQKSPDTDFYQIWNKRFSHGRNQS